MAILAKLGLNEQVNARVWRELKPYRTRLAVVLFLGLIVASIQPISVGLVKRIVEELQKGKGLDPSFFRWVPVSLVAIFLVSGLAKYFHSIYRRYITEHITIHYRSLLYGKYLHFPLSVLDEKRGGELLSAIQNDLTQINQGFDTFVLAFSEPFNFFGLVGVGV
jgi:ABC-type multidrug transport system fused ATPase/permease subunit